MEEVGKEEVGEEELWRKWKRRICRGSGGEGIGVLVESHDKI